MKHTKLVAMLLALLMVLAACAGQPAAPAESGAASESAGGAAAGGAAAGGDLVVSKETDLLSMDSSVATDGTSFEVLATVQEGLYVLNKDGTEQPAMAESVEISEDGLTYTFKIRDAKWSNGDPVTANDFVYAWRRSIDPNTASDYAFIFGTAGITNAGAIMAGEKKPEELGVTAVDDKTLEVKLDHTVPFFQKLLSFGTFLPQNQKFVEEQGDQYAQSPENMVYSGPFKMVDWVAGNSFKVEKNPDYWDAANVKLNSITWKVTKDPQTAALDFDSEATDYVRLTGEVIDRYSGDERVNAGHQGYLWYLVSNYNAVPEFKNVNLMKAIANAVDRQNLVDTVLKDGALPGWGYVPKDLAVSPSGVEFREDVGTQYFNEGAEAAKKYAETAFQELGITSLDIELLFEDTEESKKVAEYIQSQLQENVPGLTVTLKSQPKKARLQLQQDRDFQMALHRWGPDYPDPMTFLENYVTGNSSNYNDYSNAEYDQMIMDAATGNLSPEDRWQKLMDAEALLMKDAMGPIPIYQAGMTTLWNPAVADWEYHSTGANFYYKNTSKN